MKVAAKGFTLLEVLVALIIVSITIISIIKATGSTASNVSYMQQKTIAHWVAMNRMTELQLDKNNWPAIGIKKETVELSKQEWEWQQEIKETPITNIRLVEIRVFAKDAGKEARPMAKLSGYLLTPQLQIPSTGQSFGFAQQPY